MQDIDRLTAAIRALRLRLDGLGAPVGFVVAAVGMIGAVLLNGGGHNLPGFFNLPALLIVGCGTLGAATISTSLSDILCLPALCHKAVWGRMGLDPQGLIETVVLAARRAREDGLLALEVMATHPGTDPFLAQGLELVVDQSGGQMIREILEAEISAMQQRHQRGIDLLEIMGGYAPTMGIIGTVLGLVHVMSQLGESGTDGLGMGVAMAFMTTLYGIVSANLLLLPLASNLRAKSNAETLQRHLIFEAIMGIQAGINPRLLELRLKAYSRKPRRAPRPASPTRAKAQRSLRGFRIQEDRAA